MFIRNFIKSIIEPIIKEQNKELSNEIQDTYKSLDNAIDELDGSISTMKDNIDELDHTDDLHDIKNELDLIKENQLGESNIEEVIQLYESKLVTEQYRQIINILEEMVKDPDFKIGDLKITLTRDYQAGDKITLKEIWDNNLN